MKEKRYTIGDKTYIQRPLVLGQMKQIREVLNGLAFPSRLTVPDIIEALEDRLPLALAVVLTPEGLPVKGKDLPALADELEGALELETAIEVVEDFFICNPVASLSTKLAGMADRLRGMMTGPTGSSNSSSSSLTETSPDETPCSGDTPSEIANPI